MSQLREGGPPLTGLHRASFVSSVFLRGIPRCASSGRVCKNVLSFSIVQGGPKVLDDISFHIKSGERVGIGACNLALPVCNVCA
jgi:ABC-type multidrug transport system fused ATPase/permease subunit